jgi:hypothetical protein
MNRLILGRVVGLLCCGFGASASAQDAKGRECTAVECVACHA